NIDGQISAGGLQTQALSSPDSGATTQQTIASGAWQTVASAPLTIGARSTGFAELDFQAEAAASAANRVLVRYLIDGRVDTSDASANLSPTAADAAVDFLDGLGSPVWHTLSLNRL